MEQKEEKVPIPPDDILDAYLEVDRYHRCIASDILKSEAVGMSAVLDSDNRIGVTFYSSPDDALKLVYSVTKAMHARFGGLWLRQLWRHMADLLRE